MVNNNSDAGKISDPAIEAKRRREKRLAIAIGAGIVAVIILALVAAERACSSGLKIAVAAAAPRTLTWAHPTVRTDGAPFNMETEGSEYRLTWTRGSETGQISIAKTATSFELAAFKAGTVFSMKACDDQTPVVCSAQSNSVKLTGAPPVSPQIEGGTGSSDVPAEPATATD